MIPLSFFLLVDHPNKKILGIPSKEIFTPLAGSNPDSVFNKWLYKRKNEKAPRQLVFPKQVKELGRYKSNFNNWLKKVGRYLFFWTAPPFKKVSIVYNSFTKTRVILIQKSFQKTL